MRPVPVPSEVCRFWVPPDVCVWNTMDHHHHFHYRHQQEHQQQHQQPEQQQELEEWHQQLDLEHHIRHCQCSCNHMGYGNYWSYKVGSEQNFSCTIFKRKNVGVSLTFRRPYLSDCRFIDIIRNWGRCQDLQLLLFYRWRAGNRVYWRKTILSVLMSAGAV